MKMYTTPIQQNPQLQTGTTSTIFSVMAASMQEILLLLSTAIAALGIILLSIWAAGFEAQNILSASTWGLGFVFLGLAVDNRRASAVLQVLTACSLFALAWLQNYVSADFVVVTGVVLAAWLAGLVFKLLK
jgi:hypothetical protein